MPIPEDYAERVYAGILGKIIGVYLGRPFEGWTHRRILQELGEIDYYVHEQLGRALVVADDDISGTFTFIRALEDFGASFDLTSVARPGGRRSVLRRAPRRFPRRPWSKPGGVLPSRPHP